MRSLIVGYGNALRGDDAVGLHTAEALQRLDLPDVEVRSVHQLTPELALDLGDVGLVVFVDADVTADAVVLRTVTPATAAPRTTHHLRPEALLALAAALDVPLPRAVAVGLPARDLGLSLTLSDAAAGHVTAAVDRIVRLIETAEVA